MSHVRQQIRDAVVTRLTGLLTTAARVKAARLFPYSDAELPALAIYTTSEEIDHDSDTMGGKLTRTVELTVEGRVKTAATPENTLDTIAAEVEAAIETDPTLTNLVEDMFLDTTNIEIDAGTETPVGVITLTFSVIYRTAATDPTTAIS